MKSLYLVLACLLLITSCKSDKQGTSTPEKEWTIAEKIANAHGFENWKNVEEIQFTFRVDRDTVIGNGRSWTWFPKKDRIVMTAGNRSFDYIRSQMDSTQIPADRAFINDKFWMLVPFQLVWDNNASISEIKQAEAPISKTTMDMITLTYPNEGGYTPGDAYDIYFDDNYLIKEWTFRKSNSAKPTLSTTFENHTDFNGITIATDHKQGDEAWNLRLTNIKVTTD